MKGWRPPSQIEHHEWKWQRRISRKSATRSNSDGIADAEIAIEGKSEQLRCAFDSCHRSRFRNLCHQNATALDFESVDRDGRGRCKYRDRAQLGAAQNGIGGC